MEGDELTALGLELRALADGWLDDLLDGVALPGAEAAAEPLWELGRLETAVVRLAGEVAELSRVESALTAGFPGSPAPALPVDGAAAEATEQAPAPRTASAGKPAPRTSAAAGSVSTGQTWSPAAGPVGSGEDGIRDASPAAAGRPTTWPAIADGQARRRMDLPASIAPERHEAFGGEVPAEREAPRRTPGIGPAPPSSVGIRGLGDLAMLAGASGLDLPEAEPSADDMRADGGSAAGPRQWDGASHPGSTSAGDASRPSPASAWDGDPSPVNATSREVSRASARDATSSAASAPAPIRRRAWDLPAMAGDQPDPVGAEWDGGAMREDGADRSNPVASWETDRRSASSGWDASPPVNAPITTPEVAPIRRRAWDQLPAGDRADASGAAWDGGSTRDDRKARGWIEPPASGATVAREGGLALGAPTPGPIALPFLQMPGETADVGIEAESDAAPFFPAPAVPTTPVSPPPVRGGQTSGAASIYPALGDADEPVALPRSARRRPAAEILAGLQMTPPMSGAARRQETTTHAPVLAVPPASRLAPEAGAAPDPAARARADEVPITVVRTVEDAPPAELPEPLSWPDMDVSDLMDALAREIMHEYRRYYGV